MNLRKALIAGAALMPMAAFAGVEISGVKPSELPRDGRAALDNCLAEVDIGAIKRLSTRADREADGNWTVSFKGYLTEGGMRYPVRHTCVTTQPQNEVASVESISFRPQVVEITTPVASTRGATNDTGGE